MVSRGANAIASRIETEIVALVSSFDRHNPEARDQLATIHVQRSPKTASRGPLLPFLIHYDPRLNPHRIPAFLHTFCSCVKSHDKILGRSRNITNLISSASVRC
jgi:hypothetical protein